MLGRGRVDLWSARHASGGLALSFALKREWRKGCRPIDDPRRIYFRLLLLFESDRHFSSHQNTEARSATGATAVPALAGPPPCPWVRSVNRWDKSVTSG